MSKLAGALVTCLAGLLLTASAQPFEPQGGGTDAVSASATPEPQTPLPVPAATVAPAPPKPVPPTARQALDNGVLIVVSLPAQRLFVFKGGEAWGTSPISTGRRGHDTPAGVFPILQKSVDHRSSLYGDAPMPYMQRLTWGGVALHAGALPGYRASHGCIRLPRAFARKLYGITSYRSTAVLITRQALRSAEQALALGGADEQNPARPSVPPTMLAQATPPPFNGNAQTIQLGAFPTESGAAGLWSALVQRLPELAAMQHAIIPATVNDRHVFRLRATGENARVMCRRLASSGDACFNVRA